MDEQAHTPAGGPDSPTAETAARDGEARYRSLIENISDWVWEVDIDSIFTYVSPSTIDVMGYEPDEMVGRTLFEFMRPDDATDLITKLAPLIEQGLPFKGLENVKWHKNGRLVELESSGFPFFDEQGALIGYRGISRDVTARRETERALARSEQAYRTLVDSMPQSVFLKDTKGRLVSCNRSFAQLLGKRVEDVQGQTMEQFHPPELVEHFRRQDQRLLASGVMEEFDDAFWRGDRQFTVHTIKVPVRDSAGNVAGILGIFWDITEKHRAEVALRESRMRYKAILENASDAILVSDADGRFIDANRRAEELFGYTREEFRTLGPADLHAPDNQAKREAAFRQMDETGASLFEHRMLRKDGTIIDVEAAGTRIPLGDGHIYLGNFRDISQRKRIEQELDRYRNQLEQLVEERTHELSVMNRELEAFSYSVSHDLRAPLRAINGFSEALREELPAQLSDDANFCLDRIRAASLRMSGLIDGLLNLSQVIRRELHPAEVDLSATAAAVAAALHESEPARSVAIEIEPGLTAIGDRTLLLVLLENLFGNAWKFTGRRADARVEFGREMRDGRPVFFVRDNGVGFDMQFAHKLFTPFERLHASGEFDGTGIGLATVRRIVERHGGTVWAESGTGQGACIYFSLGMKEAQEPAGLSPQT